MTLSTQEALARLAAGEDPSVLLRAMRPPEEVALAQRAAATRWFDRGSFDVLRAAVPHGTPLDFDSFVQKGVVEIAPGESERYRIRDGERAPLLAGWRDSSEFRDLNASLAEYHHRQHKEGSVDELHYLCAAGGEHFAAAQTLFVRLFTDAEARFDIARCTELIDIVDQPEYRLPDDFRATIAQHRCYVQARTLWADEFYRTIAYYNRTGLEDAMKALVVPEPEAGRWILQIYALGGMGKTTFVRWATSRFMAPARIACARLDFDADDPVLLTDQVWRLVWKLARDLNPQIVGGPFTGLVKELGEQERLVRDGVQLSAARQARYNDDAFPLFTSCIAESAAQATIVILCDTLEQVELHYPGPLLALIDRFADLHARCSNVRVILSGRYNLDDEKRMPLYKARYHDVTSTIEIGNFSAQEGHDYLTRSRGLPDDDRVAAIVERSDGVPFKLALFANLVQDDPTLTAQAIRDLEDVHVEYLIKRVIDRIKDGLLKWVVRHGVVPRRLTRAFLTDVMLPLLADIQKGKSSVDTGKDPTLPQHLQKADRFPTTGLLGPDGTIDVDALWQALRRYAADYSWIREPKDWKDTLLFHGDVINPMRRLLQEQEAFDLLHERAIAHYEDLAQKDAKNWARWMREAIYHRFQKDGMAAEPAWQAAYDASVARGDLQGSREIAEELLGAEYVDDGAPRLRQNDAPMVTWALLTSAACRAAWAGVQEARLRQLPVGDAAYSTADLRLNEAERAQRESGQQVLSPVRVALVRAALAIVRAPDTAPAILDAVRADVTDADRADFEELEGDARAEPRPADAISHYGNAIMWLGKTLYQGVVRTTWFGRMWMKLADVTQRAGDHPSALHAAERALKTAEQISDASLAADARLRIAEVLLAMGDPSRAFKMTPRKRGAKLTLSDDQAAALDEAGVRALCDLGEPLRARRLASRYFREAFVRRTSDDTTARLAYGYGLKAHLHELFCENAEAADAWREARECWDRLSRPDRVFRCTMRGATLLVRKERELETASQMISDAEREASALGPSFLLEVNALEIERLSYLDPRSATTMLDIVLDQHKPDAANTPRAAAAVARQAFAMVYRETDAATWLASMLERVKPPAARLRMLKTRDRALYPPVAAMKPLAPVLEPAVDAVLAESLHPVNEIAIAAVWVLWWLGRESDAKKLIDRLARRLGTAASLYPLLDLRILAQRVSLEPSGALFHRTLRRDFLAEFEGHRRLYGRFLLAEACTTLAATRGQGTRKGVPVDQIEQLLGDPAWLTGEVRRDLSYLRHPEKFAQRASEPEASLLAIDENQLQLLTTKRRRAVRPTSEPTTPSGSPQALLGQSTPDVSTWRIAIKRDGEFVSIDRNGAPWREQPIGPRFRDFTGASIADLTKVGHTTPGAHAAMQVADSETVGDQVRRLILDDDDVEAITSRVDLRLEMAHSVLGAMPWELATYGAGTPLVQHPNVRSLYRAAPSDVSDRYLITEAKNALHDLGGDVAVEYLIGPRTLAAIRRFQTSAGLPVTGKLDAATRVALRRAWLAAKPRTDRTVLIVRRGRRAQYAESRGVYVSGRDIAYEYLQAGWLANLLLDPTLEELENALRESAVDVLHLNVSAAENPSLGGLYLDVGRDLEATRKRASSTTVKGVKRPTRSEGLSVSALGSLLDPFPRGLSPIVVLDPPRTPGSTETARQLLLRNAFASDLFQLGVTPAIIATGLAGLESAKVQDALSYTLTEGLAANLPLRDVCAAMRLAGRPFRYALATALFVHDPDYVPPPHLKHPKEA